MCVLFCFFAEQFVLKHKHLSNGALINSLYFPIGALARVTEQSTGRPGVLSLHAWMLTCLGSDSRVALWVLLGFPVWSIAHIYSRLCLHSINETANSLPFKADASLALLSLVFPSLPLPLSIEQPLLSSVDHSQLITSRASELYWPLSLNENDSLN